MDLMKAEDYLRLGDERLDTVICLNVLEHIDSDQEVLGHFHRLLAPGGHAIILDDGNGDTGARPAELIPLALAGCTAMDVISILRKKRQDVRGYRVETEGHQMEAHPNAFTRIDVTHVVTGVGIDPAAVRDALLPDRR